MAHSERAEIYIVRCASRRSASSADRGIRNAADRLGIVSSAPIELGGKPQNCEEEKNETDKQEEDQQQS